MGAPVLVALVTMLVFGITGRRVRTWVRATLPAIVLVALTVAQALAWRPYLLPFLLGPAA